MRPTLILQPIHSSSADILRCFAHGKPLSCDQLNFLEWNQKLLSKEFDPVYKYYIEKEKQKRLTNNSFLMPLHELTFDSYTQFKKRLHLFLQQKKDHIELQFTPEQLLKFKEIGAPELIFYHGNQFLTGAPFFPGGIPPVLFFQWGNLFGVAKYVLLAEERNLHANVLVYFEDMQERDLNQCVLDYQKNLQNELKLQNEVVYQHKLDEDDYNKFLIKTPRLSLDPMKKMYG